MAKTWEKSKVDVYFDDIENDKIVRQGFNNLVDEAEEGDIQAFVQAIDSLHELDTLHAVVTESHRIEL